VGSDRMNPFALRGVTRRRCDLILWPPVTIISNALLCL